MAAFDSKDIDPLIITALFGADPERRVARRSIRGWAQERGITLVSISKLYRAWARDPAQFHFTVPAINIRGLSYDFCRAIVRVAKKLQVGAFIIELARSEMRYTNQRPDDLVAAALAAALREGFRGPLFLQGDHYQINPKRDVNEEVRALEQLISESINAGIFNIDIDASTAVDLSVLRPEDQQRRNGEITAHLTQYIRRLTRERGGDPVNIGGEIGEIGGRNSTVEDLDGFMAVFQEKLGGNVGLSKLAIQTGTRHGGIPGPDGTMIPVRLDFETLQRLSQVARKQYGLVGVVQHGASTLPEELFGKFPEVGTAEIHLSTEFQNIIFHHPAFPQHLREKIDAYVEEHVVEKYGLGESKAEFLYRRRKLAWGAFQKPIAELPVASRDAIAESLEDKITRLFRLLRVENSREIVDQLYGGL